MFEPVARGRIVGLRELQHPLVGAARIDQDARGGVTDKIAQHAQADVQLLIQQLRRAGGLCRDLQISPQLVQIGDVGGKIQFPRGFLKGFRHGADDVTALMLRRQHGLQFGAQSFALLFALDALRHADVRLLRQKNQQATGDAELRGKSRALAADGLLDDLHQQGLAFEQDFFDRLGGIALIAVFPDVGDMQECRPIQADVDKGRLHARQYAFDLAEIDVADDATVAAALDVQILHHAELHHCNAGLLRGDIDEDLIAHGVA